jgi:hypothetical protein
MVRYIAAALPALTGFADAPASGTMVLWSAEIGQTRFPVFETKPTSGKASIVSNVGTCPAT